MNFPVTKIVDVKYVEICVAVRYGDEDMPYDAPMRVGDKWNALIDIDQGRVIDWPQGEKLKFSMKICDEGTYILLDADENEVYRIDEDYVPNSLLPGEYGDYLSLDIDETGKITNWKNNASLCDFIRKQEDEED